MLDGSGRRSLWSALVAGDASMPGQNQSLSLLLSLPHSWCSPLPPTAAFLSQMPIPSRLLPDEVHTWHVTPLLGQELLTCKPPTAQLTRPCTDPPNHPPTAARSFCFQVTTTLSWLPQDRDYVCLYQTDSPLCLLHQHCQFHMLSSQKMWAGISVLPLNGLGKWTNLTEPQFLCWKMGLRVSTSLAHFENQMGQNM